jgi:hypothetical protein
MDKQMLFIIGAAKAGTTTLQSMLNKHPEIYFSPIKEPNHFCTDIKIENFTKEYKRNTFLDTDKYFSEKELKPLQLSFVKRREQYLQLFKDAEQEHKILAEASTSYMFSEIAAHEIYKFNEEAKILVILRNPAERAFSHYLMGLRYGYTTKNFREEIENDQAQKEKGWGISKLYLELGFYYEQLKRYFEIFPKEQIKVVLFDDFSKDPKEVLEEIHSFLCVDAIDFDKVEKENTAVVPKNYKLNSLISKLGIKSILKNLLGEKAQNKLKSGFFKNDDLPELSNEDREYLIEIYKEDIVKTASLIGRNLNHWLV